MNRIFARRLSYHFVGAGADEVVAGISLPSDSVINDIRVRIKLSSTTIMSWDQAAMYAVEGWILPVLDPDSASTHDAIWDQLVPKDTDVQTLDLDTGASAGSPFYEPGEAEWSSMLDIGLRPERLYHRHRLLHVTDGASLVFQDNQSPFAQKWNVGDSFDINIKRRLRVRQPSVLVFGFASPNLDDTTATVESILAESEWGQVKYIQNVLERALLHLAGVVEAGAETPWEEASTLLQKHADPDVFEDSANKFTALAYDVYTEAMFDHSVVGTMGKVAVTTGR